jgi:4-amino-4-deoxy-L-arabinose transferase-like glycosyltransferase
MENSIRSSTAKFAVEHRRPILLAILGVFLVLSVATICTKVPLGDEAWYGDPAFNLVTHGNMGTTVLESAGVPRLQGVHEHTYWEMPLYILTEAAWFKVVGFGLIRQRLLSTFWGMVLLTSWMIIVARLFGDWEIALVAGGLLAVDAVIVSMGSVGRTDMMCAALGCAGLAAYLSLRENQLSWAFFVSQALIAASGMTHPNGLLYFMALLVMILWFDRGRLLPRHFGIAVIPYITGALLWSLYIAKALSDFRAQFGISAASRLAGALSPWLTLKQEIVSRYFGTYWFGSTTHSSSLGRLRIVPLIVYLIGVVGALLVPAIRRRKPARLMLILTGLTFFTIVFYEGAKQSPYLVLILPYFAALLALFFLHLRNTRPVLAAALILCFVVLNLAPILYLAWRDDYRSRYLTAVQFLQREVPNEGALMGGAELGYGLGFDRVIDDYKFGYDSGKRANLLVVNGEYENRRDQLRIQRPKVADYIQDALNREHALVFDSGLYKIYAPPTNNKYATSKFQNPTKNY